MNPYRSLFHAALAPFGVHCECDCHVNDAWLNSHAAAIDAIHLHWPEPLWRERQGGWSAPLRGVAGLTRYVRRAKRLGIKRIWTLHNVESHEGASWIDRIGYRVLASESDLILCHSQSAAAMFRRKYRVGGSVVVMAHGNYDGVYPSPRPRQEVLRACGLREDRPLLVAIGNLRDYKGFDLVADAARRLRPHVQFLIAGQPHAAFDIGPLRSAAAALENLVLVDRQLTDQEFSDFVSASEAVLLPYRKITGSGALLAAWSLGRPVIGSDLDYFREVAAPEPAAARFFAVGDRDEFAGAISAFLAEDPTVGRMSSRRISEHFRWERCVQPVAEVIGQWQTGRCQR
ncbi:glycosyltransferase [Candidatus Laterigemmans baculatus]|uniref:glycosyltransferase n=1 Tax=Candidatus Laterigemmans baculatus TaxID=2770505 RepID=UPI0013DB7E82|nr:glycosyltransferase [Candidatus Laterigemmans baculatus]